MSQDETTSVEETDTETYDIEENQAERARKWPAIGVALAVLWLFVRGVHFIDKPGLAAGEFVIGLAVGLPIAYGIRGIYAPTYGLRRSLSVLPAAGIYLSLFLWELVTANVDVARRVLSPSMPIEPNVVEVPLRVESDVAITTIANSITLTPGTLTMDYDEERNSLFVHALAATDEESVVEPIRRWEDYALVIFDERLSPGSPVPEPEGGADDA
ncbi:Na+/H+ antiporter subunit E [Haloarchaeobius iranensis]|uniref:Multicomponent Na+:H+ antiporter subunit E n=1 Tax=Haloarchaeobius iranensis TaxID=996166 RepID=A0A1G9T2R0_9EURY|nr:Na+/H+ antiporter subunit E [Haloarchaeobius iranensis]SDM41916.1 multicomponent Na+:H+ antiporter subunit E [Haloarchaeobius iranensis]